jgi:hypothetical protein
MHTSVITESYSYTSDSHRAVYGVHCRNTQIVGSNPVSA